MIYNIIVVVCVKYDETNRISRSWFDAKKTECVCMRERLTVCFLFMFRKWKVIGERHIDTVRVRRGEQQTRVHLNKIIRMEWKNIAF